MRVAVVGAGIFGTTIAARLAREHHDVVLFERLSDILRGASGVNQLRLHKGFHYPRSPETTRALQVAEPLFVATYGPAIESGAVHLYAIAADSRTPVVDYLTACAKCDLDYSIVPIPEWFAKNKIELCVQVRESAINIARLRDLCLASLVEARVDIRLGTIFSSADAASFDHIVVVCYSGNNKILRALGLKPPDYHYKVCELPIAMLPARLRGFSVVIMDGRYPSFDPLPGTGLHLLGHVDAMHHCENIGVTPSIPRAFARLMDGQWHAPSADSTFGDVVLATAEFVPSIRDARHLASMFTVRAFLPSVNATDERPTIISTEGNITSVFSGKLTTCVVAAREIGRLLGPEPESPEVEHLT